MHNVFLTILALIIVSVYHPPAESSALPHWTTPLFAFAGLLSFIVVVGTAFSRRSQRALAKPDFSFKRFVQIDSTQQSLCTFLTLASFWVLIHEYHWSGVWGQFPIIKNWESVFWIVNLTPFIIFHIVRWCTTISHERRAQHREWSVGSYLRFKCFPLLPIVPVLIMSLLIDLTRFLPLAVRDFFSYNVIASTALLALVVVTLISSFPFLLRFVFRCHPLPAGELRDEFEALLKKSGVRCRDILVWPTGGLKIPNAVMTGIIPGLHYIFITDELLRSLPLMGLRGVFAHEVGHAKHRHLFFLSLFIFGFMFAVTAVQTAVILVMGNWEIGLYAAIAVIALLYWGGYMGYAYRRFERQADLYGARLVGDSAALIAGLTTIQDMVGSFRKIPSFFHFSIDDRVRFLLDADRDPEVERTFNSQVRGLKIGMVLFVTMTFLMAYPFLAADAHYLRFQELLTEDREIESEHYLEAEVELTELLQLNPLDFDSRSNLARIYTQQAVNPQMDTVRRGEYRELAFGEWLFIWQYAWNKELRGEAVQQARDLGFDLAGDSH